MRGLLHVLAILLALPQLLVCALFLLLGHVTAGGTLGSLFARLLDALYVLFTWGGLLALIGLVILVVAGFITRTRRAASAAVAALIIASTVALFVQLGATIANDPLIFLPGFAALLLSATLAVKPGTPVTAPRPQQPRES